MKKGDIRKLEYIQTAERLFCKNGYEATSVQDILDTLHTSKGSFYHHFPSKESLLSAMCVRRAGAIAAEITGMLEQRNEPTDQALNLLLSGMLPLAGERLDFLLMLIPVFALPEGWTVQRAYCQALSDAFYSPLLHQLQEGHKQGLCFIPHAEKCTRVCLQLVNELWCDLCESILLREREGSAPDLSDALSILETYRICLERILTLPYGSLTLMNLSDLQQLALRIHSHWK